MGQSELTGQSPHEKSFRKGKLFTRKPAPEEQDYGRASSGTGLFIRFDELTPSRIQEEERRRIAELLHNNIGQLLYVLKLKFSRLSFDSLSEKEKKEKEAIESLLDEAIESTKNISFELMPPTLKESGLRAIIEELCTKCSSDTLHIRPDIQTSSRLAGCFEVSLYRIVQELVNNIVKHSNASKADIIFRPSGKNFEIIASDNGTGFDLNSINKSKCTGLHWIRYHVELLKGVLTISSAPGKGTSIHIKLKVQ